MIKTRLGTSHLLKCGSTDLPGNWLRLASHSQLRRILNKMNRNLPPSAYFSSTQQNKVEEPEREKCCRIVLISDTHSVHQKLGSLPAGDILIHAGDFSRARPAKPGEYKDFFDWLVAQPHRHKILISGNRDQLMDSAAKVRFLVRLPLSLIFLSSAQTSRDILDEADAGVC